MEDEAYRVIKPLVVTECVVAAFMCNDPKTGANAALDGPINWPGQIREKARKGVEVMGGNIVEGKGYGEIVDNVGE